MRAFMHGLQITTQRSHALQPQSYLAACNILGLILAEGYGGPRDVTSLSLMSQISAH